jgi:hypothetical protein
MSDEAQTDSLAQGVRARMLESCSEQDIDDPLVDDETLTRSTDDVPLERIGAPKPAAPAPPLPAPNRSQHPLADDRRCARLAATLTHCQNRDSFIAWVSQNEPEYHASRTRARLEPED